MLVNLLHSLYDMLKICTCLPYIQCALLSPCDLGTYLIWYASVTVQVKEKNKKLLNERVGMISD